MQFARNTATSGGGAVYNLTSQPVFNGVLFNNNSAITGTGLGDGGAVYNWQSDATIINSSFSNNRVDNIGGAVYTISSTLKIRVRTAPLEGEWGEWKTAEYYPARLQGSLQQRYQQISNSSALALRHTLHRLSLIACH